MTPRLQAGGTLRTDAIYIERPADTEILTTLNAGENCYVFAPRQIGKSSLSLRAFFSLQDKGARCGWIDFLKLGSNLSSTTEQWYFSLIDVLASSMKLSKDPATYWNEHQGSPVARWIDYLEHVVLTSTDSKIVIFLDEVDLLRSTKIQADDFFGSILHLYNQRTLNPEFQRLSFCLIGVTSAGDLVHNPEYAPSIFAQSIALRDFTREDISQFAPAMNANPDEVEQILNVVYDWTSGHPYMTQKLCIELSRNSGNEHAEIETWVRTAVEELFLQGGRTQDYSLATANEHFNADQSPRAEQMLQVYRRLLARQRVPAEKNNEAQRALLLTGLASEDQNPSGTLLKVRNRIFAEVFDQQWLDHVETDQGFTREVARWIASGEKIGHLRGTQLKEAVKWAKTQAALTPDTSRFLQASQERKWRSASWAGVTVVSIILLLLVGTLEYNRYLNDLTNEALARSSAAFAAQKKAEAAADVADRKRKAAESDRRTAENAADVADRKRQDAEIATRTALRLAQEQSHLADVAKTSLQITQAEQATLLSERPGRQLAALVLAIQAAAPSIMHHQEAPNPVFRALAATTASMRNLNVLKGHQDAVNSAAFSPDGARIVTASRDHTARIWDARTGKQFAVLQGHTDAVEAAIFSPDGSRIVTYSYDATARTWDARTGKQIAVFREHTAPLSSVAFSPDGARVITASYDKTARIWDARTGKQLFVLQHAGYVYSAAFSPDSSRIVTGSGLIEHSLKDDDTGRIWNARTGKQLAVLQGHTGGFSSTSFSPDGSRILSDGDGPCYIWDGRTGKQLAVLGGRTDWITSAAFCSDGTRIVTVSGDHSGRIWDARTGKQLAVLGEPGHVTTAAFSSDGSRIVTASGDNTCHICDGFSGKTLIDLTGHTGIVTSAAFSPDGSRIVTASIDHTSRVWRVRTGQPLVELKGTLGSATSDTFSPDGSRIVTRSRIWDVRTGKQLAELKGHKYSVNSAVFSPDGSRIVTASDDETARIWDGRTGQLLTVLQEARTSLFGDSFTSAIFSPDGSRILSITYLGKCRIWDVHTGKPLAVLDEPAHGVTSAAFSRDGSRIVITYTDGPDRICDGHTGKPLVRLSKPVGTVSSTTVSPDGSRLVVDSDKAIGQILDARTGKQLAVLQGHSDKRVSFAFSPDGSRIVTTSDDEFARIWDGRTGQLLTVLQGHTNKVTTAVFSDGRKLLTLVQRHTNNVTKAVFSPDGSRIVTDSDDGTLMIYGARAEDYFRTAANLLRYHPEFAIVRQYCESYLEPDGSAELSKYGPPPARAPVPNSVKH